MTIDFTNHAFKPRTQRLKRWVAVLLRTAARKQGTLIVGCTGSCDTDAHSIRQLQEYGLVEYVGAAQDHCRRCERFRLTDLGAQLAEYAGDFYSIEDIDDKDIWRVLAETPGEWKTRKEILKLLKLDKGDSWPLSHMLEDMAARRRIQSKQEPRFGDWVHIYRVEKD